MLRYTLLALSATFESIPIVGEVLSKTTSVLNPVCGVFTFETLKAYKLAFTIDVLTVPIVTAS